MGEWKEDRVTGCDNVADLIAAMAAVNEDGMATGLQPYEIRHFLLHVREERKAIDSALRHMPYLGGMHRTKDLGKDLGTAVKVLKRVAETNGEIERNYDQIQSDLRGMRRILGTTS